MADVQCVNADCDEYHVPKGNPMGFPADAITCGACGESVEEITETTEATT